MIDRVDKIVTLRITWWGVSLGGTHFTGEIRGADGIEPHGKSFEIQRPMTGKEAKALNKKDETRGGGFRWKPGTVSGRFDTEEQLIAVARKQWRGAFPQAEVLQRGDHAVGDPQEVLEGPSWFKERANLLHRVRNMGGGYEGNEALATACFRAYRVIVKLLNEGKRLPAYQSVFVRLRKAAVAGRGVKIDFAEAAELWALLLSLDTEPTKKS